MGVREKVALSVVVIVLVGIACTFCIPRSAKKSALKNYYNTLRKSKINRGHKGLSNQVLANHDFSNYIQQNQPVNNVVNFPDIEFPQMSNTYQMPTSILNEDENIFKNTNRNQISSRNVKNQALSKHLDNLRKFEKLKRKLGNTNKVNDTEIKTECNPDLFCFKTPGSFPEVEYPQSITDTRMPKFWNYMPYIDKKELADDFRDSKAKLLLKNFSLPFDSRFKNNKLIKSPRVYKTTDLKRPPSKPILVKPFTKETKINMINETQVDKALGNLNTKNIPLPYQTTKFDNTEDKIKSKNVEVLVHKTNKLETNAPLQKEDVVISRRYRKSKCTSDPYYQNNNYTTDAPMNSLAHANIVNETYIEETTENDESDDHSKMCLSPVIVLEDIDTEKIKHEKTKANSIESFNLTSELCDDDTFEMVFDNLEKLPDPIIMNAYLYKDNDTDSKEDTSSLTCNMSANQRNIIGHNYETTANEYFNNASNKETVTPSKSSDIIDVFKKNTFAHDMNLVVVTAQPYLNDFKLTDFETNVIDSEINRQPKDYFKSDLYPPPVPPTSRDFSVTELFTTPNTDLSKILANENDKNIKDIKVSHQTFKSQHDFIPGDKTFNATKENISMPKPSDSIIPTTTASPSIVDYGSSTTSVYESPSNINQNVTTAAGTSIVSDILPENNTVSTPIDPNFNTTTKMIEPNTSEPHNSTSIIHTASSTFTNEDHLSGKNITVPEEIIPINDPDFELAIFSGNDIILEVTTSSPVHTTALNPFESTPLSTTGTLFDPKPMETITTSTPFYTTTSTTLPTPTTISTTMSQPVTTTIQPTYDKIVETTHHSYFTDPASNISLNTKPPNSEYDNTGTTPLPPADSSYKVTTSKSISDTSSTTSVTEKSTTKASFAEILSVPSSYTSANTTDPLKESVATNSSSDVKLLKSTTKLIPNSISKIDPIFTNILDEDVKTTSENKMTEITTLEPNENQLDLSSTTCALDEFNKYQIIDAQYYNSNVTASSSNSSANHYTVFDSGHITTPASIIETTTSKPYVPGGVKNPITTTSKPLFDEIIALVEVSSTPVASSSVISATTPLNALSTEARTETTAKSSVDNDIYSTSVTTPTYFNVDYTTPMPPMTDELLVIPANLNEASNIHKLNVNSDSFQEFTNSPRSDLDVVTKSTVTELPNSGPTSSQHIDEVMTTIKSISTTVSITFSDSSMTTPSPRVNSEDSVAVKLTDIKDFVTNDAKPQGMTSDSDMTTTTNPHSKVSNDSNENTNFTTTTGKPIYTDLCDDSNSSTISSSVPYNMNTLTTNFPSSYVTVSDLITTTSICEVSDTDSNNYFPQSTPTSIEVTFKDTDPIDFTSPEKEKNQRNPTLEDVPIISDSEIVKESKGNFTVLDSMLNCENARNSSSDVFDTTPLPFHSSNTDYGDMTKPSIDKINTDIISYLHENKYETYLNHLNKTTSENVPSTKSSVSDIKMSNPKSFQIDKLREKLLLVMFESIDKVLRNSTFINTDQIHEIFSVKTTTAQPDCDDFDTPNNTCVWNITTFSTDIIDTAVKPVPNSDNSGRFLETDTTTSSSPYTILMTENSTCKDIIDSYDTEFVTTSVSDIITTAKPLLDTYPNSEFTPNKIISTTPLADFDNSNDETTTSTLELNDPNTHLYQMTTTSAPVYENNVSVTETSSENNSVSPETITFGIPEPTTCLPFKVLNESLFLKALMPKKTSKFTDNFELDTFSTSTNSSTPEDYIKNVIHRDTSKQSDKDEEIDSIASLTSEENISDIGNMDDDYPILTNIIESIIDQYFLDMYYDDDSSEIRIEKFGNQNNNEYQDMNEIMIENNKEEEYLRKMLSHLNEYPKKTNEIDDEDGDAAESTQNQSESNITKREDSFNSPLISNLSSQTIKDGDEPLKNGSMLSSSFDIFKSNLIKALDIVITKLKLND